MMSVIEQVCELIDTTDDVFSFKVCLSLFFVKLENMSNCVPILYSLVYNETFLDTCM